jgi:hypothetical protein
MSKAAERSTPVTKQRSQHSLHQHFQVHGVVDTVTESSPSKECTCKVCSHVASTECSLNRAHTAYTRTPAHFPLVNMSSIDYTNPHTASRPQPLPPRHTHIPIKTCTRLCLEQNVSTACSETLSNRCPPDDRHSRRTTTTPPTPAAAPAANYAGLRKRFVHHKRRR